MGGFLGPEIKFAGWSYIVIIGKSENPVYLYINNSQVELKDAAHIWGSDVWDTESILRDDLGDQNIQVASIGIAGENLVPMASLVTNKTRSAGSGGIGAIIGSKKLKAIAVRGTGKPTLADPTKFAALANKINDRIMNSPLTPILREHGTFGALIEPANNVCAYPFRNTQDDHFENIELSSVSLANWKKTGEYFNTCYGCPIQCGRDIMEADEGPYKGLRVNIPKNNTFYAYATR